MKRIRAKRFYWLFIPIFLLLMSGGVLMAQRLNGNDIGNLQIFKGSAVIIRNGQSQTGQTGSLIDNKDHIKAAANSTVALILKDNTIIRLEAGSEVEVTAVTYQNNKLKDAEFSLISGRMWSRVQPLASGANFDVETPTVTAAVRGTSFNTTFKNRITGIFVYHHIVQVTLNSSGENKNVIRTQLLQMHQTALKTDFDKGPLTAPNSFYDDWIKFNMQQDDQLCRQRHDIPGDCSEPTGIPVPLTTIKSTTPQVAADSTTAPVTNPSSTSKPKITPTPPPTPQPITLQSLNVSCVPVASKIVVRYVPPTYRCSAQPVYSDKSVGPDVTSQTAWSVLNTSYGTISSTGIYSYVSTCYGNTVTGKYQGKQNTFSIPPAQACIF